MQAICHLILPVKIHCSPLEKKEAKFVLYLKPKCKISCELIVVWCCILSVNNRDENDPLENIVNYEFPEWPFIILMSFFNH